MQRYRVYLLDEHGHISSAVDLECPDDDAAKEAAKELVGDRDAELWQQDRLVAVFGRGQPPTSKQP
jgi:hypothetical protein